MRTTPVVHVATSNPLKVRAVKSVFGRGVKVVAVVVRSPVLAQPISMGQIVRGARGRAEQGLRGAQFSVGIEAGIFRMQGTYYNVTIAAVTDGRRTTLGGSPFFEVPERLVHAIAKGEEELGLHFSGRGGGAIGAVTGGRVTREEVTRLAVEMALAPWRTQGLYV